MFGGKLISWLAGGVWGGIGVGVGVGLGCHFIEVVIITSVIITVVALFH